LRLSLLLLCIASSVLSAQTVDFTREVQPIFDRACANCHGADQQAAGLRFDAANEPARDSVTGGDPDHSELYLRIAGATEKPRMPMGGELPASEVDLIRRWIDQGADWPQQTAASGPSHWAFIKPERPVSPKLRDKNWAANEVDRFVLARLEREKLKPSAQADRITLLRRAHLDLTGLPPTLEEADIYLADKSPEAYSNAIDRLLASPHYGERWGRHWLDAARYADSDGFEKDKQRRVWFYRDWVINALNKDMPYDQFIIEQIAGDLLPNPTQDQVVATGFLRNSMINEEGGADPEQFRMEAIFDRMTAIGTSVMGLTIQCAQCHNHKFDPFSQKDYYRALSFLNNSHEANVAVYTPEEQQLRAEIFEGIRAIEDDLKRRTPDWPERIAAWESEIVDNQPAWKPIQATVPAGSGERYLPQDDGSILAYGYAPTRATVSVTAPTDMREIRAFRLELLMDPNLPLGGPGRSFMGTAALTEFEVEFATASDPNKKKKLKLSRATADVNPPMSEVDRFLFQDKDNLRRVLGEVDFAIDGFEMSAWSTDNGPGRRNQPRKAVFELTEPLESDEDIVLTFNLVMKHGGWNSDDNQSLNLGRFRISATAADGAEADPLPESVREILSIPAELRSDRQEQSVFSQWRTTVPQWAAANAAIETLWERHPEGSAQLVLMERDDSRMTHVLKRGDFLSPLDRVESGTPGFLNELKSKPGEPDRLTFARWLVDRDSPTAARTIVNRTWQAYFGTGLVETSEDLGRQSTPPSHPELLDWLAVEFMDSGWSLKHLHRLIVTSNTYQQASKVTPELLEKDPNNRLLARGPRVRVEAEIVRDIALSAAGLLNRQVGGAPVYPPAPEHLFLPPTSYGPKRWYPEQGPDRYRRALYTFRYRSALHPSLDAFDAPNGNAACVRRTRSNTPLQALTTLNETIFLEAARALASSALEKTGDDTERLGYAFRRCLTRKPTEAEAAELLTLLERQRERFSSGELDPWAFAANQPDVKPVLPGEAQPADLAAWTAVSRVLLNLDETITKE